MSIAASLTLIVLAGILAALMTSRFAPELVMLFGLSVLLICGVIEPERAFSGFSNPAVVALAGLYILSGSLRHSGVLDVIADRLLRESLTGRARARLIAVVTPLSAFLNNTPLVALLIPIAKSWAKQQGGVSASVIDAALLCGDSRWNLYTCGNLQPLGDSRSSVRAWHARAWVL